MALRALHALHAGGPRFGSAPHSLSADDHSLLIGLVNVSTHMDAAVTQLTGTVAAASGAATGIMVGLFIGIFALCCSCCGAYYFFIVIPRMQKQASLIMNQGREVTLEMGNGKQPTSEQSI